MATGCASLRSRPDLSTEHVTPERGGQSTDAEDTLQLRYERLNERIIDLSPLVREMARGARRPGAQVKPGLPPAPGGGCTGLPVAATTTAPKHRSGGTPSTRDGRRSRARLVLHRPVLYW